MDEDLNIERRTLRLILLALNRTDRYIDAAHLLGISHRTLFRKITDYKIMHEPGTRKFYRIEKIPEP